MGWKSFDTEAPILTRYIWDAIIALSFNVQINITGLTSYDEHKIAIKFYSWNHMFIHSSAALNDVSRCLEAALTSYRTSHLSSLRVCHLSIAPRTSYARPAQATLRHNLEIQITRKAVFSSFALLTSSSQNPLIKRARRAILLSPDANDAH